MCTYTDIHNWQVLFCKFKTHKDIQRLKKLLLYTFVLHSRSPLCPIVSLWAAALWDGAAWGHPSVSRSSPQRDWKLSWGCPCMAESFCSSMSQPGTHSHITLLHMLEAPLGNSPFFPSWIVSNQRSRVSRGRKSVVGHCRVSESLHCPSELRAGVRLAGVVSYQIHNRRNTLHILQDSEKEWYDVPFHYGCFPPLWFEFSMFTSCNPVVEKLQNVQCPLHQWVHQSEGGSRQFSEREYHCHTVITLSPRSNKAVFGAPLLPCPSGRMISNTSPEKVLHSNNYKRSWAVLHLRFFIYVLIKAFPSLSDL